MIRNRRHHRRVTAFISIMTRLDGREQYVSTTNVSAGGGFISSADMPPLGSDIDLHFRSARGPQAAIRVLAEVVRLHPPDHADVPGFAVRWRRGYCLHGERPLREFLRAVLSIADAKIRGDANGPCEFDFPQPALVPDDDEVVDVAAVSGGDLRRAAERARADIAAARRRSSIGGGPAPTRPRRKTERMGPDERPQPRLPQGVEAPDSMPVSLRSTSPGVIGGLSDDQAAALATLTSSVAPPAVTPPVAVKPIPEQTTSRARRPTDLELGRLDASGHPSDLTGEALARAIELSEEATVALDDGDDVAEAREALLAAAVKPESADGETAKDSADDAAPNTDVGANPPSETAEAISTTVAAEARRIITDSSPERSRPPTSLGDEERRRLRQSPALEPRASSVMPRTPQEPTPPTGLRKLFTATSRLFGGRKDEEQPRLGRFAVTEDGRFYRPGEEETASDTADPPEG